MISCVERDVRPSKDNQGYKKVKHLCGVISTDGAININIDGEPLDIEVVASKDIYDKCRKRAELHEKKKALEAEIDQIKDEVRQAMGAGNILVTAEGEVLAKLSKSSFFDGSQWLVDNDITPILKPQEDPDSPPEIDWTATLDANLSHPAEPYFSKSTTNSLLFK